MKFISFSIFSIWILVPAAIWAQALQSVPSVRATGSGSVFVRPDQVKIDIGVVTQSSTADAAASRNAAQLKTVLDQLHAAIGSKGDIRTISYSLNPVYQYPKNGGKPSIEGYTAANTVEITSSDLVNIGKLIDSAAGGGANEIRNLQFSIKDERPARSQALREAALEARSNAEAMATALGLKLGRVLLLEQSTAQPVRPMMMANTVRVAGAPTPIESEPIEVRASVSLTVAVEQ